MFPIVFLIPLNCVSSLFKRLRKSLQMGRPPLEHEFTHHSKAFFRNSVKTCVRHPRMQGEGAGVSCGSLDKSQKPQSSLKIYNKNAQFPAARNAHQRVTVNGVCRKEQMSWPDPNLPFQKYPNQSCMLLIFMVLHL